MLRRPYSDGGDYIEPGSTTFRGQLALEDELRDWAGVLTIQLFLRRKSFLIRLELTSYYPSTSMRISGQRTKMRVSRLAQSLIYLRLITLRGDIKEYRMMETKWELSEWNIAI